MSIYFKQKVTYFWDSQGFYVEVQRDSCIDKSYNFRFSGDIGGVQSMFPEVPYIPDSVSQVSDQSGYPYDPGNNLPQ